ncbi:hypothetical protein [Actinoplanes sp. URMC 104]|uniref:hypothetical protein n=1 Tax=Actinoplanes sp. URMC 104 TaxID=3423409 RepID=UPI003F1BAC43
MGAVDIVRAEALFCSDLSPIDLPDGLLVRGTVDAVLAELGVGECAARLAQAYGDDEMWAAGRMRWCAAVVRRAYLPVHV